VPSIIVFYMLKASTPEDREYQTLTERPSALSQAPRVRRGRTNQGPLPKKSKPKMVSIRETSNITRIRKKDDFQKSRMRPRTRKNMKSMS